MSGADFYSDDIPILIKLRENTLEAARLEIADETDCVSQLLGFVHRQEKADDCFIKTGLVVIAAKVSRIMRGHIWHPSSPYPSEGLA
ncbi:hypothetical protein PoB_000733500 [Plakobranchus ocellatus]|uniref:Uncharacterized protein n=1 Tax=Plakobranchus ocellatus TaxID=259542 RepID=A0AAV3YE87_9GAST|nr:hypothetical protein PoB_000733500 [Plakobranchus ocellatus]